MTDRLFPALLKYWRGRHGQSQLDLALSAGVSARHISFLESGRAKPSDAMVLRLMTALDVPLREQNEALRAAGFVARFPEPDLDAISPAIDWAIERMLRQQEPYPLTLLSADYRIIRSNRAASRVFELFVADPTRVTGPLDMFSLLFDPGLARSFVVDWELLAGKMLARLHREILHGRGDSRLSSLLDRVLSYPDVNAEWRRPDLSTNIDSTLNVWLQRGDLRVGFMTTITVFSAPRLVTLEELRIESYFPLDEQTRDACERLANASSVA
ncbi:MAG: helix-turn-helix transcriptional regulator [Glaciimonas sp.]|nr:helix-turn-helix transcriptional regulator [Glaciimonas sp.]